MSAGITGVCPGLSLFLSLFKVYFLIQQNCLTDPGVVGHTCNPSTLEVKGVGLGVQSVSYM